MNKNRGFTLVELLAVLVVLGIIATISTPAIINQVKKSRSNINSANLKLIYSRGETYIREQHKDITCVKILDIVDAGYLTKKEIVSENIDYNAYLKYNINNNNGNISYELKLYNDSGCSNEI